MLNPGTPAVGPGDGDNVEAGGMIEKLVTLEIGRGKKSELALLSQIDGFSRMALVVAVPRFDFDEDDRASLDGHEIQLAHPRTDAAPNNAESATSKIPGSNGFTALAQGATAENRHKPISERAMQVHEQSLVLRSNVKPWTIDANRAGAPPA